MGLVGPGVRGTPQKYPIGSRASFDSAQGSWSVVGHSGSIAIHISMSPSNELLFFERPHTTGGYVGQNPYLTVLPHFLV